MAALVPTDKVKDKEYSNWLKATLALYYMKTGLHTFIQSEVDHLHQSLVLKIYGGNTVPLPPCNMCQASYVQRNKFTGAWTFPKQCKSYCDVWLYEMLKLHTNPKSEKIYWDNSHVPSWPFKPWECAKVFMPRGQPPSSVGPTECDAQAMLTLLANCTHFHSRLSLQGLNLTHTISAIRNKVMHDSEMKLSDADRRTYIQQIIQLLEDPVSLNSLEDCKAAVVNIQKIDNDSLDVFFNLDTEMTCLRSAVNELRLELGVQEKRSLDTVDFLKEEYKQLREQITKRFVDVENRMDSIERNVQSVKDLTDIALQQQVQKHKEMEASVTHMSANVISYKARLDAAEENVDYICHRSATIERTVQSVKEQTDTALQQQKKKHEEMQANVISHEVRLDAVEENVQSFSTQLQELKTSTDTALQQQEKKHEELMHVSLTSHGDRLNTAEENVQILGTELQLFKTNTDTALQQQEKKHQNVNTAVTHLSASVTSHEIRLAAVEDNVQELKTSILTKGANNSGGKMKIAEEWISEYSTSETPVKRRQETDGLKQLKSQTEDKLDTVRRLECIPTAQAEEAKKLLERNRSIVIKGNPGEGKTTTALHLIDRDIYRDRRALIYSPRDWKTVDTDYVDIIVLEDILGQYDFDPGCLQKWMMYLPTIQEHVDAGKLMVIITTRVDIMLKAYSKLGTIKLFFDNLSLTLSSHQLQNSEKMHILNRELQRHKRKLKECEKEKCIVNFNGLIGFPQCCTLFAGDSNLFDKGPEFFKSPEKLFVVNITNLEPSRFLCLAFLFCYGMIDEEELSPETMQDSSYQFLMKLASRLSISKRNASVTLLREAYDAFSGLYVLKSISDEFNVGNLVKRSYIWFSHATVYAAVGQVLGDRCLEMVVDCCDASYLYQKTYTAEAKDSTSQNIFLPVSLYGLFADRMVYDVVKQGLVEIVVKHSAIKQHQFLIKLKETLHQSNMTIAFFMSFSDDFVTQDLSEGDCASFLQYILRNDEDVVLLVYNKFLEVLACTHNYNTCGCWQCEEKQNLLELALYYHHFEIADKLISMNVNYTHTCLCNAARHGDIGRIQNILETLKQSRIFNPQYSEASYALCRAYIAGHQDIIEFLLKEGIVLRRRHIIEVVKLGNMNTLMKVIEHLKCCNKWNLKLEQHMNCTLFLPLNLHLDKRNRYNTSSIFSTALYIAYCKEMCDMADYLVKNGVNVSVKMFSSVARYSSQTVVARVIQTLKDTGTWDSCCIDASDTLQYAYSELKYNLCDLLVQEGVSLTMRSLCYVIGAYTVYFESVKKVIQHLKDTNKWDPKCDTASEALENAFRRNKHDVSELLVQEGISLTMKNLKGIIIGIKASYDSVKEVIQHLKDTNNWNPKCDTASEALEVAYTRKNHDVYGLLLQEGISLTMKNLNGFIKGSESVRKALQLLKDTANWDAKCYDASQALETAYSLHMYDVCDLLAQEGVLLTMKNFPGVLRKFWSSFESTRKAIQHLKDNDNWDPRCCDASKALGKAYDSHQYYVCDLLVEEGVLLTMKNFPGIIQRFDRLPVIKILPDFIHAFQTVFECVKKAIQYLKDTTIWDPNCKDASEALENAYLTSCFGVYDMLIQEGISLSMKNLTSILCQFEASFESVKKAIQHLKDTGNWDPRCDDASKAFSAAYGRQKYDVCDLLLQEGILLTMKDFICILYAYTVSLEYIKKAIRHLKDNANWDPKCDEASKALGNVYGRQKYDLNDLLIQEGVSLKMKALPFVIRGSETFESVKKAIQYLKYIEDWDPKCDIATQALEAAYCQHKYDMCDLLTQEGVTLTMTNLLGVICAFGTSFQCLEKVIQHLKDNQNWDPRCDDASKTLGKAYDECKYDACDLLVQEGVSLTIKNLPSVIHRIRTLPTTMVLPDLIWEFQTAFEYVRKVIQHLKNTDNWYAKCEDANKALEIAYIQQMYDVCDLLVQEGVSLTMNNIPGVISQFNTTFQSVEKAIHHLKDTDNWDPKCVNASKALESAYGQNKYDVCNLLIQSGVRLTMKNICGVIQRFEVSSESVRKVIKQMKDTKCWDPKCDDAFRALRQAYDQCKYGVCDVLLMNGVSITMKILFDCIWQFQRSNESIKKSIQQLKETNNWDPNCEDASEALEISFVKGCCDVCDILILEGVSLTMNNLLDTVKNGQRWGHQISLFTVKKVLEHLKDAGKWDPMCDNASEVLASYCDDHEIFNMFVKEGVSLTMKHFPGIIGSQRCSTSVEKAIQYLKDTDNWDPKCDYASKALAIACRKYNYDVCEQLIQNGMSLTMLNLHMDHHET